MRRWFAPPPPPAADAALVCERHRPTLLALLFDYHVGLRRASAPGRRIVERQATRPQAMFGGASIGAGAAPRVALADRLSRLLWLDSCVSFDQNVQSL